MIKTTYQKPEIRDANDNIIQQGAFGKNTALANATNDGWIDYVANDLEFLYDLAKDEIVPVPSLPASGQMNKTYLLTTTGVSYRWSGTQWVAVSSSEAVGRAETAATNAQNYANAAQQSADDAQDTADDIAEHLVQIDKNTGGVAKNSKRISNIEKLLQGSLYDYDTDDDTAYTKTVPSGALPYAGVEKIGGKTLVWNQLCNTAGWNKSVSGITITAQDGVVSMTGTATASIAHNLQAINVVKDHKYLLYTNGIDYPISTSGTAFMQVYGLDIIMIQISESSTTCYIIGSATDSGTAYIRIRQQVDETYDLTFVPQLIDLTLMFGAGSEPSTLAEFEAMFPADYYEYNAGTLLSAGVTSVVSKDSNDDALQTLTIPAEVRALEGYGWSAGSVSNYIDFERKVYVQNVGRVDLGTLTYTDSGVQNNSEEFICANNAISDRAFSQNLVCAKFVNLVGTDTISINTMRGRTNSNRITFYWTLGETASNFKSYVDGVYLYYELATPIETDISAYLTDNLIEVGAGGTLTFPNSNGDNYRIPVPSEETYMINLQEAVSNG